MPVGVPKVAFQLSEDDADWVDLLYRQRFLFLTQEVNSEISNQIVGLMVYLSLENQTNDLLLFINSPGGWIIPGVAIYDIIQAVPPDVRTVGMGVTASMASLILGGGTFTKRFALPNARIMIHQPISSYYQSPIGDYVLEVDDIMIMRENIIKSYVERTGQPFWVISEDIERDVFMSATEAQAHGIVDVIAVSF
uniref:ATP-dependent Clp protease proteolytic subunit n=1 Tax=Euphorbia nutans TaxID=216481 RepID=UPI0024113F2C|nr:ATP-dependent Clp protease proteolytic subunit [Euphorbia nutans]WEH01462.1 ATP-dependent Clp protease proteolytic subunit [Euphorbia nutans]